MPIPPSTNRRTSKSFKMSGPSQVVAGPRVHTAWERLSIEIGVKEELHVQQRQHEDPRLLTG